MSWVRISSGELSAAIDPFGAELASLTDAAGRELMTDADPSYWTGRAPLLFPIVGALADGRYRLDGRDYAMPKHGFARRSAFTPVEVASDRTMFRLTDSPATHDHYPFAFALEMSFALAGATLTMAAALTNPGEASLPASFGYHPSFAWPLPYGAPRAAHRIDFAADEPGELLRIDRDGLIAPAPRPSPLEGRMLHLADALFADDALIWAPVASRSLRYGAEDGPALEIGFDAPMLGIWTKPGARFVCIEPWWGHADPAGFAGDIRDKPGIMLLAPGETRHFTMRVTLAA